jgi:MscS family membrane protein
MVYPGSMQFSPDVRLKTNNNGPRSFQHHYPALGGRLHLVTMNLLPRTLKRDSLALHFLSGVHAPIRHTPSRCSVFVCRSAMLPGGGNGTALVKSASVFLTRSYDSLLGNPIFLRLIPALGIIAFAVYEA